jgi:putative SOS response-associated peptidase YedK
MLDSSDGFYEWKKVFYGKVPYSIGMKDNSSFVFAGARTAEAELCAPKVIGQTGGSDVSLLLGSRFSKRKACEPCFPY